MPSSISTRGLAAVAIGATLAPLNSTMIVVALPDLTRDLSIGLGGAGWLVTGYLAAMAFLQPLAGRVGDALGRANVLRGGAVAFGLASLACAVAPNLGVLIVLRIAQGAAGAIVMANGIALIREGSADGALGRRLGIVQATIPVGAMIGPAIAGLLVAAGGWRAIFWVNLPVSLLLVAIAWSAFPREPRRAFPSITPARALAAFLIPRSVLRSPGFLRAAGAMLLSNIALHATLVAVPVVLANRLGWESGAVGATLALFALAAVLAAPPAGRLADRSGRALPAAIGLGLLGFALAGVAIDEANPPLALIGSLALAGAGIGLSTPALQAAALEAAPVAAAGSASGGFATGRYLGSIIGATLAAGPVGPGTSGDGDITFLFGLLTALVVVASLLSLRLSPSLPGRVGEATA